MARNNVLSNNCSQRKRVDHQFMFIEVGSFVNPIQTVINQSTNVYVYMCLCMKYIYTYLNTYIYIYKILVHFTHNLAYF